MTVLWRVFFTQFFTSETVTSDVRLHQAMIGVLAFLLPPGLFVLVQVFPAFEMTVIFFPERVDGFLEGLAFVFVAYSMVSVGLIAAFVWDALTFELRDAMVLGPMPLTGRQIVSAKLVALAVFLLGASAAVNVLTGATFAFVTANRFGVVTLLRHSAAYLAATIGASVFVFTVMVMLKGMVTFLGGPRVADRAGSWLQWFFVTALLCFVILLPTFGPEDDLLRRDPRGLLPTTWFVALFEWVRGSPVLEWRALADRGPIAMVASVTGAIFVSIMGYRRQMRLALVPSARTGILGAARVGRALARWMSGTSEVARATADFVLLSIARGRAVQTPLAVNAAVGAAIAFGALWVTSDRSLFSELRSAVLWIPMLMGYWIAIGLRGAFFVPSELPAAWVFHVSGPHHAKPYWAGVRAALLAYLLPRTLLLAGLLIPVLGWRTGAWHILLVFLQTVLLVEVIALTINHVPFTRPYEPGHARLKTRWPMYLVGMLVFAYWPARLEMSLLESARGSLAFMVSLLAGILLLHAWAGSARAFRSLDALEDLSEEPFESVTTLNLAGA